MEEILAPASMGMDSGQGLVGSKVCGETGQCLFLSVNRKVAR